MTFEEFLTKQYINDKHPLDDDIADGFPNWYSLQDIEQICNYAEIWKLEILIEKEEKERAEIQAKLDKLNKGI